MIGLVKFGVVGAIGFAVDATVLHLLAREAGVNLLKARSVSFLLAVAATWWLNRRFTFRSVRGRTISRGIEYMRYLGVQVIGATINYAVFAALLMLRPAWSDIPIVPLAIASGTAMVFNYFGARRFAFADVPGRLDKE